MLDSLLFHTVYHSHWKCIVNVWCMHIHVYSYFVCKVSVLYHSKICSEKMHLSVTLDSVAGKLKQAIHNLYYRSSVTGVFMVLLCCEVAIVSLFLIFVASLYKWPHMATFYILHTLDFWFVQLQLILCLPVGLIVTCCYLITSRFFTESCYHCWGPLFACWILHHDILTNVQIMQRKVLIFCFCPDLLSFQTKLSSSTVGHG